MNHRIPLVPLALFLPCLAAAIPAPPPGNGQIEREVETIVEPKPPAEDAKREFAGQRTTTGKLVLTASNGFFDPGIRAAGEAAVKDAAPDSFIAQDFEYLHDWTKEGTTMRWHVWIETPGELFVNLHLVTDKAGAKLKCGIGGSVQTVETRSQGDASKPQGAPLAFKIATPGWHTFRMELEKSNGGDTGKLHRVELFGPAAEKAAVLRTRWRPSAAHARFSSSEVAKPRLWVMTSRMAADTKVSSYSPITTPFGYYGTSFKEDGTSSGGANFSLWSFGRGKPTPQEQWAHLLATGSPEAEFGSFGHEGSGVKLRGDWAPFAGQKEVTVALRYEVAKPWIRWFGYYLDPETKRFRLYAAAAKWAGAAKKPPVLNPGSFVEQPGPPDRRRCGDLVRDIHRRGWMLDEQNKWHPVDTMGAGKEGVPAAKHWTTTPDGWFSTGMGGMARRPGTGEPVHLKGTAIPSWLNDQAIEDLHRMPATIGPRAITASGDFATLKVPITGLDLKAGEKATVTAYYDTQDCLTFFRDLGYNEGKTRFWQNHTQALPVKEGENTISLKGLSPGTAYHSRILVESPRGRVWSFESDSFATAPGK